MNIAVLILFFGLSACVKSTNKYIIEYASKLEVEGKIEDNPLLVIDGYPHSFDYLEKYELSEEDVYVLGFLDKTSPLFGEFGERGVILITTKKDRLEAAMSTIGANNLYIVNNVKTPLTEMKNVITENIKSIEIIEGEDSIRRDYSEEYDVVFKITLM